VSEDPGVDGQLGSKRHLLSSRWTTVDRARRGKGIVVYLCYQLAVGGQGLYRGRPASLDGVLASAADVGDYAVGVGCEEASYAEAHVPDG
jgi:hypothetical protein